MRSRETGQCLSAKQFAKKQKSVRDKLMLRAAKRIQSAARSRGNTSRKRKNSKGTNGGSNKRSRNVISEI